MRPIDEISDEQLNALLDNELHAEERAEILSALQEDKELSAKYCELGRMKEMVNIAYQEPPQHVQGFVAPRRKYDMRSFRSLAAGIVLLSFGIAIGWVVNSQMTDNKEYLLTIAQVDPSQHYDGKILFHINTKDNARVEAVLDTIEKLLSISKEKKSRVKLEIVTNSKGLDILRKGSPFEGRIRSIVSTHDNVSFLACGRAKKLAGFIEGREINLLSEAIEIPAAIDQILKRLQMGWTYIRG